MDIDFLLLTGGESTDRGGKKLLPYPELDKEELNEARVIQLFSEEYALIGWYCWQNQIDELRVYMQENEILTRYDLRQTTQDRKMYTRFELAYKMNKEIVSKLIEKELGKYGHIYIIEKRDIYATPTLSHDITYDEIVEHLEHRHMYVANEYRFAHNK